MQGMRCLVLLRKPLKTHQRMQVVNIQLFLWHICYWIQPPWATLGNIMQLNWPNLRFLQPKFHAKSNLKSFLHWTSKKLKLVIAGLTQAKRSRKWNTKTTITGDAWRNANEISRIRKWKSQTTSSKELFNSSKNNCWYGQQFKEYLAVYE